MSTTETPVTPLENPINSISAGAAPVVGLVVGGWGSAQGYASGAYEAAVDFLSRLRNAALELQSNIPANPINVSDPDQVITPFVKPTAPGAPVGTFAFSEPEYFSELLTNIQTQLDSWLTDIATGLPPAVEQALWERARVRENTNLLLGLDTAYREAASKGFKIPTGALFARVDAAVQETTDKNSALSRDISIKQAELEQNNKHFAIENSVKLEAILIEYNNTVAQRAFEVAKATLDAAVSLYEARAKVFEAEVAGESARVSAEVEIYKAQSATIIGFAGLEIDFVRAQIGALQAATGAIIEAMRSGAATAAQLAAAALSAVNLSGSISAADQNSTSASTQFSNSNQTSTSASNSTTHNYNIQI